MAPFVLAGLLVLLGDARAPEGTLPGPDSLDRKDAKGRTLREIRQAQRDDSLRAAGIQSERARARTALLEAVSLEGDTGACVVFDRVARECRLSVGGFNRSVADAVSPGIPDGLPAPSPETVQALRNSTLDSHLEQAFLRRPGNPYLARAEAESEGGNGDVTVPEGMDPGLPERLFREDWVSLARVQGRMRFEIYASTDSALVDSLGRVAEARERWSPARHTAGEIPEAWVRKAPGLVPGKWGPPFRTRFGWARMKTDRKPPSLRESLPVFILYASLKAITPAAADRAYPDTARGLGASGPGDSGWVSARLLPRPKSFSGKARSQGPWVDSVLDRAASRYPLRTLAVRDLPASVAARPATGSLPGARTNPFPGEFGYWWIESAPRTEAPSPIPVPADPGAEEALRRRNEADRLIAESLRILDAKRRDKVAESAEAAWSRALEADSLAESLERPGDAAASPAKSPTVEERRRRAKAEWISTSLRIRPDFPGSSR
jgi:hypothetical protein